MFGLSRPRPHYIESEGEVLDVMIEQLEYLASHTAYHCDGPGCPECVRLGFVRQMLLRPFAVQKFERRKAAARA